MNSEDKSSMQEFEELNHILDFGDWEQPGGHHFNQPHWCISIWCTV